MALVLLRVLVALETAPVKFTRFCRTYAEQAASNRAGQGALFAAEKVEPVDALRLAADQVGVSLP